jgi:hypothetical protein
MQEKNSAVPSEPHEVLYHRLRDITARVKTAVDRNDLDTLPGLVQEHEEVMAALQKAGVSKDHGLLSQVTELSDQVQEVVIGLRARKDEIGQQLKATGIKKKLDKAYGV